MRSGADKVEQFGWVVDGSEGAFKSIDKNEIKIDYTYQRKPLFPRVYRIAKKFNWAAFGTLIVAFRNKQYFVIDGQNRLLAAMKRSDIKEVPCIVYHSKGQHEEANWFYEINGPEGRKNLNSVEKYRSLIVGRDKIANHIQGIIDNHGYEIGATFAINKVCFISTIIMEANKNIDNASVALNITLGIYKDQAPPHVNVYKGLVYIGGFLSDEKLYRRIASIGYAPLEASVKRFALAGIQMSRKKCAEALLEAINLGLKYKYEIKTA